MCAVFYALKRNPSLSLRTRLLAAVTHDVVIARILIGGFDVADEAQATVVALAVGVPLMCAGFYALKRINPNLILRTTIGCVLLIAGIFLADTLANGSGALYLHPVRLGIAISLLGLGINQATAPLRVALGKSA